jgi:hypothetical protein
MNDRPGCPVLDTSVVQMSTLFSVDFKMLDTVHGHPKVVGCLQDPAIHKVVVRLRTGNKKKHKLV